MRNPLFKHQVIEYPAGQPFWTGVATQKDADYIYVKSSHWHEDLEIAYVAGGHNLHYIDGQRVEAGPGSLVVTNCESIHHIQPYPEDVSHYGSASTVVLLVSRRYLEEVFPGLQEFRFTNDQLQAGEEARRIMGKFAEYSKTENHAPHEILSMQSHLLQLIAILLEHRSVKRESGSSHVGILKDILEYVEEHYHEPVTQAEVAKMFYFSPQSFSRFFKRCTGQTFLEHLTRVRLEEARMDLLYSDELVRDIALANGFPDDKSFINAFKKAYAATPLQYKKQMEAKKPQKDKNSTFFDKNPE